MCTNWKNELIPSGQDFIPSQKYCQMCMCDDNIATDCRNITCDFSKCTENLSSLCCSECIKSSNTTHSSKSEVQNDAINNNPNRVDKEIKNVDSFDHTTNHVEGNEVETTVSNHTSVEEKDETHKVTKEEKISNQNITEDKENITTLGLVKNVTSVVVTGTTEQVTGTSFTQHFYTQLIQFLTLHNRKHNFDMMIKKRI